MRENPNWVVMNINGSPTSRSVVEPKRTRPACFEEWRLLPDHDKVIIYGAWEAFCDDLRSSTEGKSGESLDDAISSGLDAFYCDMQNNLSIADVISMAFVLVARFGDDMSSFELSLYKVVLEQASASNLLGELQGEDPPNSGPRSLWEQDNGMIDLETRTREVVRILTKHKMIKEG